MYVEIMKKNAVEAMRREALRLRGEYLDYAEDMKLYANPDFWKAVEQVESGKARKLSATQLAAELEK